MPIIPKPKPALNKQDSMSSHQFGSEYLHNLKTNTPRGDQANIIEKENIQSGTVSVKTIQVKIPIKS